MIPKHQIPPMINLESHTNFHFVWYLFGDSDAQIFNYSIPYIYYRGLSLSGNFAELHTRVFLQRLFIFTNIILPHTHVKDCERLDQVNSANLFFELWSMDIMIYDSTGSLQGSTGWYLMVLGQYRAILVVTWWYWVSIT